MKKVKGTVQFPKLEVSFTGIILDFFISYQTTILKGKCDVILMIFYFIGWKQLMIQIRADRILFSCSIIRATIRRRPLNF
jgi:hypothetical protein